MKNKRRKCAAVDSPAPLCCSDRVGGSVAELASHTHCAYRSVHGGSIASVQLTKRLVLCREIIVPGQCESFVWPLFGILVRSFPALSCSFCPSIWAFARQRFLAADFQLFSGSSSRWTPLLSINTSCRPARSGLSPALLSSLPGAV